MNTKFNKVLSLIVFYALVTIFMPPAEANPVPANSVFTQNEILQSVVFDGKGTELLN